MNFLAPETKSQESFRTKFVLLWMNLSSEPLVAIYSMIPFLLRKEIGATTYQIVLFSTLSPVVSVLSFYWGAWLSDRKNKLLPNLVGAWVLARLPFLFFPWVESFWAMFICCSVYQLFSRASTPALMEILKRNMTAKARNYTFSFYYGLSVIEGVVIGLLLSQILEFSNNNWRMVFLICSLISLSSVLWQLQIKVRPEVEGPAPFTKKNFITHPLRESLQLMQTRPDFAIFQWGFMIGGFALMLISPVRSIFIADQLPVSIADVTLARCVFVGLGMAGSTLIWRKALELYGIHRLVVWILLGFGLFPLVLLLSSTHLAWFYFAHLLYGFTQGGSHLIWNLSGTIFAGDQNSTPFTTVNVLMIGLRGAIAPILGGVLCNQLGPAPVLALGACIALFGSWYMQRLRNSVLANPKYDK
jgi:predicted MFS family arabinose efflux permease